MKRSKTSLFTFLSVVIVDIGRVNFELSRSLNSAIVWLIEYPLFAISIFNAILVIIKIAIKEIKWKEGLFVLPGIALLIYFIYVMIRTLTI